DSLVRVFLQLLFVQPREDERCPLGLARGVEDDAPATGGFLEQARLGPGPGKDEDEILVGERTPGQRENPDVLVFEARRGLLVPHGEEARRLHRKIFVEEALEQILATER